MAGNDTLVNCLSPVTKRSTGTVAAFPDTCKTPTPGGPVPVPYPNIAQSADLAGGSTSVKIDGAPVCLKDSNLSVSTGDEAGSAGGVVSSRIKGQATPINGSFDVKIEGKVVVRNTDPFIANNRNTPPAPIFQPQVAPAIAISAVLKAVELPEPKCPYCHKEKHPLAARHGNNMGNSGALSRRILQGRDQSTHPWYSGAWSLAAHHVICSEAMDTDDWREACWDFGYDINHRHNGVMLPANMESACQIHAPLHQGPHSRGRADGVNLAYPDAVKAKIAEVLEQVQAGSYCDRPDALVRRLDKISREILGKIDRFAWTITSDGKDYRAGGNGCGGVSSIRAKTGGPCPQKRRHGKRQAASGPAIPVKQSPLEIGT